MRKKLVGLAIAFALIFPNLVQGQSTQPSLLESILLIEKKQYRRAIQDLSLLIAKERIPSHQLPEAHYFLGQAYIAYIAQNKLFRKRYPQAVSSAYIHCQTAVALDEEGRYRDLALRSLEELQPYLYNEGVYHYNKDELAEADYYFGKAVQNDPLDFEAQLSRSFVALATQDTSKAISMWQTMTADYADLQIDTLPTAIEQSYQLLTSYYPKKGQEENALAILNNARTQFPSSIALKGTELKVYQDQPLKQQQAIQLFEDILQ